MCRFVESTARIFVACSFLLAAVLPFAPQALLAEMRLRPKIWLTPFAPYLAHGDLRRGASDYFDLFKPGAPWSFTAERISVFKIYRDQVVLMPDDALRAIFRGLADRHIALAMETNILTETSTCGPGADKAKPITPIVARLRRLGGDLRYLALNEPLASGHLMNGPNDCHASIQAVAADVAESLKPLWAVYPNMQVGDIEPIGRLPGDTRDWPTELVQWMEDYEAATGRPFAFMHADTVWGRSWSGDLRRVADIVHDAKIPFGVIYNGDFTELSAGGWAEDTANYAKAVEDVQGIHPDQVVFQSWDRWPERSLPDTDPTTITGMVRDYLRKRTHLALSDFGRVRLTDDSDTPIGGAILGIDERDAPSQSPLVSQLIVGEVPPGVTSALFAMRINTECVCPRGPAHFVIRNFDYSEQNDDGTFNQSSFKWDMTEWAAELPSTITLISQRGNLALDVAAQAEQAILLNGPHFPVHAGTRFEARVDWRVSGQSKDTDYVAIIFLGPDGIERRRTLLKIRATWDRVGTISSNTDGFAVVPPQYLTTTTRGRLAIYFQGDSNYRPTRLDLP